MKQLSLAMIAPLAAAACGAIGGAPHVRDDAGDAPDVSLRGLNGDLDASHADGSAGNADATIGNSGPHPNDASAAPDAAMDPGVTTGPWSCGFSSCAPGQPCPDLVADQEQLIGSLVQSTQTFAPTDCALVEGCILTPGTRKLLRFDTATQNVGTADLTIGDPTANACFMWSECHQHYHFRGVAQYTLYQADGTTVAAVGHKQGFCLEDVETIPWLNPQPANPDNPYVCTYQGLHVGWEDVYPAGVDCQWIDVTDVPPGQYVVSIKVNAEHFLPESNYDNNEARAMVTIK